MIDLQPAPVPELSQESMALHRATLLETIARRRRRPVKWVALVGATGVAASVSALLLMGGSEPYTFAGWSASPTAPATGELTSGDTVCQAALTHLPPSVIQGSNPASLTPELSDVRGPYTVTVFGNGSQSGAMCVSAPGGNAAVRWISWSDTPVGKGAIALDRVSVGSDSGQPYTLVEGRTGDGVTGVALSLENGSQITATIGNGFLLAWWPGSESITSAVVSTASGSSTQPLAPASSSDSNSVCQNQTCG